MPLPRPLHAGLRRVPRRGGGAPLAVGALATAVLALAACGEAPTEPPVPRVASVVLEPSADTIIVGGILRVTATAKDAWGGRVPGVRFAWASSDEAVLTVDTAGLVTGVGPGTAEVRATAQGVTGAARITVRALDGALAEARALWVTRWDWTTPAEIQALLDGAARARFNIVYFQVRGNADAWYRPGLEPWARRLTGRLGQDPGWDPLGVALSEARTRGLELHVWLNALLVWCPSTPPTESTPRHILLEHPDWVMVDAGGQPMPYGHRDCVWVTPGQPGVRGRLAAVAADIARRYDVDGVHLDFIRYPGPNYSYDSASLAAFTEARRGEPALGFDEFRRRLVTAAVREVGDSLRAVRPAARLSAAVWGVYKNVRGWSSVLTGYEGVLQDARAWADQGLLDALAPMVYWPIAAVYGDRLDFAYLADEHARAVKNRHVYIGISLENIDFTQLALQIQRARDAGAQGVSILSARLIRERNLWDALARGPFRAPAVPPPMAWRSQVPVAAAATAH